MTTTKQYDYLNRLTSISSAGSQLAAPVSFSYSYNSANQRTRNMLADNSCFWSYGYDTLGQVTSGKKYWSDQTPVAGQQFGYAFDGIGNRTQTLSGGDQNGANLRSASYSANSLNQYTSCDVPGFIDIKGASIATNAVTVNGLSTYRKGEYFRQELPMTNNVGPIWTNITISATGQSNVSGNVFLAKTAESFTYDADGNVIADGRWTYGWDGENRLTNMTSLSTAPTASKLKLDFTYDNKGRRIQKLVWTNNGSVYGALYTNRFVYDAWNLIGILTPNSSLLNSFTWGSDLSGSPQGAGGVGGLLGSIATGVNTNSFAYDGNGNVATLVNATDGTAAAQYEFGPFGEVIRATRPMAKANPFGFSTKYQDDESDLLYYGYRYYNSATGRWMIRDPFAEEFDTEKLRPSVEDANLYQFVLNEPLIHIDNLGLYRVDFHFYVIYYLLRMKGFCSSDAFSIAFASQHIDDDPATDPITLGRTGQYAKLAQYHFAGSGPNTATKRDDPTSRGIIRNGLAIWEIKGAGDVHAVGAALHLYADSWSHEGFTAWDNEKINDHGGWIPVYIGHANVGSEPDLPFKNTLAAEDAVRKIYGLIPDLSDHVPDVETVANKCFNVFRYADGDDTQRVTAWKYFIKKTTGDDVDYERGKHN